MTKILKLSILILATSNLCGCAASFKERKAPCPPTASLSANPCNSVPINVAFADQEKEMI